MKTCSQCHTPKPLGAFRKSRQSKDGRLAACIECTRERRARRYQDNKEAAQANSRQNYQDRREAILKQKKAFYAANRGRLRDENRARVRAFRARLNAIKDRPCMDCSGVFPACCMDFDHRDGRNKKGEVSALYAAKEVTLKAETGKCDLVCKVCHRTRTMERTPPRKPANRAVEERLAYLERIKQQPCAKCGKTFHPAAMDLHHIDPFTKERGVALLVRQASMQRLQAEIEKCVLWCANCHAIHHAENPRENRRAPEKKTWGRKHTPETKAKISAANKAYRARQAAGVR